MYLVHFFGVTEVQKVFTASKSSSLVRGFASVWI